MSFLKHCYNSLLYSSCLLAVVISVLLPSVTVPVVVCPFYLVRKRKEKKFSRLKPSFNCSWKELVNIEREYCFFFFFLSGEYLLLH
jgi:hypothetical protein